MGCDHRPKRLFRILLKTATDSAYSLGGGGPVEARTFREALEIYCQQPEWQAPRTGRYEYAVLDIDGYNLQTFTVEPTPGYTITAH